MSITSDDVPLLWSLTFCAMDDDVPDLMDGFYESCRASAMEPHVYYEGLRAATVKPVFLLRGIACITYGAGPLFDEGLPASSKEQNIYVRGMACLSYGARRILR